VSRLGLEVKSLGVYPLGPRSSSCGPTKGTPGTAQSHSKDHLRLTLYKLTDWLASLDLHKPYTSRIRLASRDPPRLIPLSINMQGSLVPRVPTLFLFFLFVCWNKPRKTILRLLWWVGSKPPGSGHTRTEAQNTCVPKTAVQTTYVSITAMINTLQVDGLACITGLSGSYSTTHPQPPHGIPPCLV